jgi:hypothetical protein
VFEAELFKFNFFIIARNENASAEVVYILAAKSSIRKNRLPMRHALPKPISVYLIGRTSKKPLICLTDIFN